MKFLSALFFSASIVFANPAITSDRLENSKNYNPNSGTPSDIPFNYYDSLIEDKTKLLIDSTDLSQGYDKRLYVGYGLYDADEKYCRYVPVGSLDQNKFDATFENEIKYYNNSYFISRYAKTYNECKNLAISYNANVYTPQSTGEAIFLSQRYKTEKFWTGFYRDSCQSDLKSVTGEKPSYLNWYYSDQCLDDGDYKTNVIQTLFAKLENKKPNDSFKCVIEFDSPDYERPQKVCAPWWRVERKYQWDNKAAEPFNVGNFLQVPAPRTVYWCKPFYSGGVIKEIEREDVTCSTYQSASAAEICYENIDSKACFVDECAGIIREKCSHPEEIELYKDYIKGTFMDPDGNLYIGKIRSDIKTYSYSCPVNYNRSGEECSEYMSFLLMPALCKSSDENATDKQIFKYGSIRRPAYAIAGTNEVDYKDYDPSTREDDPIGFFTTCEYADPQSTDANFLFSPVNKISATTDKCIKYEEILNEVEKITTCIIDREYTKHEVNTSLNEIDIYENNESCVRVNNIENARDVEDIEIETTLKNHTQATITRVSKIGNIVEAFYESDDYYRTFVMNILGYSSSAQEDITQETSKEVDYSVIEQKINDSNIETAYNVLLETILKEGRDQIYNGEIFFNNELYFLNLGIVSTAVCSTYNDSDVKGEILFSNTIDSTDAKFIENVFNIEQSNLFDTSKTFIPKLSAIDENNNTIYFCPSDYIEKVDDNMSCQIDRYQCVLKGLMSNSSQATKAEYEASSDQGQGKFHLNPQSKVECVEKGIALGMYVDNFGAFLDGSDIQECVLRFGSVEEVSYEPVLSDNVNSSGYYTIIDYNIFIPSDMDELVGFSEFVDEVKVDTIKINGASDILAIQEFVSGDHFGWYTSSFSRPLVNNETKVNGVELSVNAWPYAVEKLRYKYNGTQTLRRSKTPYNTTYNWEETDYIKMYNSVVASHVAGGVVGGVLGGSFIIIDSLYHVISGMLSNPKKFAETSYSWSLKKELDMSGINELGIKNNYNYERRIFLDEDIDNTVDTALYYSIDNASTGEFVNNTSKFNDTSRKILAMKKDAFSEMGIVYDENSFGTDIEYGAATSYPKCDFWEYNCDKKRTVSRSIDVVFNKHSTTHYLNAVNRLVVVVPFAGDYKLSAMNSLGNVMAEKNVTSSSFSYSSGNKIQFTQVQFGKNMKLAPGIIDGNITDACRSLDIVEWGGGVSGVYYEEQGYEVNNGDIQNYSFPCSKSSDVYVNKYSPNQILFKDLSTNNTVVIPLKGKLPYPNQIFIISLGELEKRDYNCYGSFRECLSDDYTSEEERK